MTRDIAWLTAILILISPASAASIKAGDDAIVISGKIESGDAATFFTIANAASARVVVLESDGGHLDPAVTIGRDIRRRGLATVVRTNAKCVSACALIWLAGHPRVIEPGGWLGLHHAGEMVAGTATRSSERGNAAQVDYMRELGDVPEWAVQLTQAVAFSKLAWVGHQLAEAGGLSTPPEAGQNIAGTGARIPPLDFDTSAWLEQIDKSWTLFGRKWVWP
jgi:hypothetical protein